MPTDPIDEQLTHEELNDEKIDELIRAERQDPIATYGTGIQGDTANRDGRRVQPSSEVGSVYTGEDLDLAYLDTDAVGEESVGGTVATPDQDRVDDLGRAAGLEMNDRSYLRGGEMLAERDDRRWELDPDSAENLDATDSDEMDLDEENLDNEDLDDEDLEDED